MIQVSGADFPKGATYDPIDRQQTAFALAAFGKTWRNIADVRVA
jgi:hypothetical protein